MGGETRDWVFPLLADPRYRQRLEELASVDLTRRSGCESCLRSLVMNEWTPETLHHVGWCDSWRRASIPLGKIPAGPAPQRGRRAVLLALLAGAALAAPLVGSQLIGGGGGDDRGGVAQPPPATTSGTTTSGSTTPGATPGSTTPGTGQASTTGSGQASTTGSGQGSTATGSTTPTAPPVDPTPRSKPTTREQQALPQTT